MRWVDERMALEAGLVRADDRIKVVAADPMKDGNLIVHFSDGTSVLYHAHFLSSVRDDDGNIALAIEPEDEAEE